MVVVVVVVVVVLAGFCVPHLQAGFDPKTKSLQEGQFQSGSLPVCAGTDDAAGVGVALGVAVLAGLGTPHFLQQDFDPKTKSLQEGQFQSGWRPICAGTVEDAAGATLGVVVLAGFCVPHLQTGFDPKTKSLQEGQFQSGSLPVCAGTVEDEAAGVGALGVAVLAGLGTPHFLQQDFDPKTKSLQEGQFQSGWRPICAGTVEDAAGATLGAVVLAGFCVPHLQAGFDPKTKSLQEGQFQSGSLPVCAGTVEDEAAGVGALGVAVLAGLGTPHFLQQDFDPKTKSLQEGQFQSGWRPICAGTVPVDGPAPVATLAGFCVPHLQAGFDPKTKSLQEGQFQSGSLLL